MPHWPFVIAAYGITFAGTIWVVVASLVAMKRAEKSAADMSRGRD